MNMCNWRLFFLIVIWVSAVCLCYNSCIHLLFMSVWIISNLGLLKQYCYQPSNTCLHWTYVLVSVGSTHRRGIYGHSSMLCLIRKEHMENLGGDGYIYLIMMIVSWAHSQSSISVCSVSADWTNSGSKMLGKRKKIPESTKHQNPNLWCFGNNYLHGIYVALGILSALAFSRWVCVWLSCEPMDCSLPDSSVHGILQARILEWVAMPSSRGYSPPRNRTRISFIFCIACGFFIHWITQKALY